MDIQGEICELEETREAMAQELVSLSNRNDLLEEKIEELSELQANHNVSSQSFFSSVRLKILLIST